MRVIKNALSEDVFSYCKKELESRLQEKESWWVSKGPFYTGVDMHKNKNRDIMASRILPETSQLIANDIKKHTPKIRGGFSAKYMECQPTTGYRIHDDSARHFAATIYMNETWHPNSGGWFVWQERDTKEWKTILPQRNLMVVNDCLEEHLVTPVAHDTPISRFTIQIWDLTLEQVRKNARKNAKKSLK